jgi:tRNA-dihydrouridine synthase
MYHPPVDLKIIRAVKQAVGIPVIGNGGIKCAADAVEMFTVTGCDGIMVARGACGNPWIFAEITASLEGRQFVSPSFTERIETAIKHAEMLVADKGDIMGVFEARKHIAWYIKDMPDSAKIRKKINCATTLDEIKNILYNKT